MTREHEITLTDWQIARWGDHEETRAAVAYWRERGWPVDRRDTPEETETQVQAFKAGYRAALAAPVAAEPPDDVCADCEHPRELHMSADGMCGIEECGCMEFARATPVAAEPPSLVAAKRYALALMHGRLDVEAPHNADIIRGYIATLEAACTPAQAEPAPDETAEKDYRAGWEDGFSAALTMPPSLASKAAALPASSPAAPAFECCWNCPGRALCLIQQRCVFPNESHGTAAKVQP